MINKINFLLFPFQKLIIFLFVFLSLLRYESLSILASEDDIYNDPGIIKIFLQNKVLENIKPELKEALENFSHLSAQKQHKILKDFCSVQDQLEKEYNNIKTTLTNRRLFKYGITCTLSLAAPLLSINWLNTYCLSEESQINVTTLPFVVLQGSAFFMFKFLELFSRKYIASWDGAIQDYEIQYVRNKPLFDKDFSRVFESKLIAAHKNPSNLYEYLKWFNSAILLPNAKKLVPVSLLDQNFQKKFSIFPLDIKEKVRTLCLRHVIQQHTRVIAYFYGSSGTGKTRCAREIADCLALPFASISLTNYTISDLIGQGGTHLPHPGKFAEAILNSKDQQDNKLYTNMVFLIDEVDKILNIEDSAGDNNGLLPFLLTFLDLETEFYYNPYFEKNIRINDALIILAGNKPLKNKALRKRLINIEFPGFEKNYKKDYLINQYIPRLYQDTEEPYKLCIEDHFSPQDKETLFQFIEEDDDLGLRNIQERARQFVDEKVMSVFFHDF